MDAVVAMFLFSSVCMHAGHSDTCGHCSLQRPTWIYQGSSGREPSSSPGPSSYRLIRGNVVGKEATPQTDDACGLQRFPAASASHQARNFRGICGGSAFLPAV